ncbi:hypothetical protein L1987_04653 [Smallanthus sonchifolius]|uniref:Uncharacterized protein n=1 Tax=Smallanthus sonchifolius TaxID=185202 RepID=A0ACB9JTC4_9ASTR|nr:hypothetical protein L1987_04653 [Smallanthus sonchifolius]
MGDLMIDTNGLEYGSDIEGDDNHDIRCENIAEKDVSDEEIEAEDLERRMWKDRIKLRRIKEKQKILAQQAAEKQKARQTSDQACRKKMSRAQDGILKYMLKVMEDCKARGFVYGIIPEKGKPVSGSSDNLRAWWKEKVKFDKNGLAAIAKYDTDSTSKGQGGGVTTGNLNSILQDLQDAALGSLLSALMQHLLSREESLILQSSGDNGGSGITETLSGGCLDKNRPSNSYDSDYDVDGFEDGRASVSSKDHHDAAPLVNDKKQTQSEKKRKRGTLKPPQQQIASNEPRYTVPDINQTSVSLTNGPSQERIPDDHTLTVARPLLVETGTHVQVPANDMLLYPLVQEHDYRPTGAHHGPHSSELHNLVPYPLYTPPIESQQPINGFQNENPNAIPGDGLQNLEKDGFHNGHERPFDNHFESSINCLSLDYGGFKCSSMADCLKNNAKITTCEKNVRL